MHSAIPLLTRLTVLAGVIVGAGWVYVRWRYPSASYERYFEAVLAFLAAFLTLLQTIKRRKPRPLKQSPTQEKRNRDRMLQRVRQDWIEGYLNRSLYAEARIDLGLHTRPESVEDPFRLVMQRPGQSSEVLPPRTRITSVYDAHGGLLLILGAAGSGKTTLLLELARDLLDRAEQPGNHQIPIYFSLSSWGRASGSLAEWMVSELTNRYDVPEKVAQDWVNRDLVLPLLDGLDEVPAERRDACAEAINAFRKQYMFPLVVCSRLDDYDRLNQKLRLTGAVSIQPLSRRNVDEYLQLAGDPLYGLRVAIEHDSILRELLESPLMLSVAMIAYSGAPVGTVPAATTIEEHRHRLWEAYVDQMFKRRGSDGRYSREQTLRWLAWLAATLKARGQSIFHLEDLRPNWLPIRVERITSIAANFILSLTLGLFSSLLLWWFFATGEAVMGLLVGATLGLFGGPARYRPAEVFDHSWRAGGAAVRRVKWTLLIAGLGCVIAVSWFSHPSTGIGQGLGIVLLWSVYLGWIGGLTPREIGTRAYPNQGTFHSLRSALIAVYVCTVIGSACAGLAGLISGFTYAVAMDPELDSSVGHILGVDLGIEVGLGFLLLTIILAIGAAIVSGGGFCLQHLLTRSYLVRLNAAPWRYVRFLDYAADRIFLRKVGGGYVFMHRLLLEHFASMPIAPRAAIRD